MKVYLLQILFLIILPCSAITSIYASEQSSAGSKSKINIEWLDKTSKPSTDFDHYANGNWINVYPALPGFGRWSAMGAADFNNSKRMKRILEQKDINASISRDEIKLRDLYFSGMDAEQIEKNGIKPILPEFNRIEHLTSIKDLPAIFAHFSLLSIGSPIIILTATDDDKTIFPFLDENGLTLPNANYYLADEYKEVRYQYSQHIYRTFRLLGKTKEESRRCAERVMRIETQLAKALTYYTSETSKNNNKPITNMNDIQRLMPHFSLKDYLVSLGYPKIEYIKCSDPDYLMQLDALLVKFSLEDWKTYLRWKLIDSTSRFLSSPFVKEDNVLSDILYGKTGHFPRWLSVIYTIDDYMRDALGKLYIKHYFQPESKSIILTIFKNIQHAYIERISQAKWLSQNTKNEIIKKIKMMRIQIGYSEEGIDYSTLRIDKGSFVLNVLRIREFNNKRKLDGIGKQKNIQEWDDGAHSVQAYYNRIHNSIIICAGIMQTPFFDSKASLAYNYGTIGAIIGHEISHGFDNEGMQYDAQGYERQWWQDSEIKHQNASLECISKQFSTYAIDKDHHIKGNKVVREAFADLAGATLAYRALITSKDFAYATPIDGYTPEQQFFLGFSHIYAEIINIETAKYYSETDPHPPGKIRINGTLVNMPEFQKAFHIKIGSPMINPLPCKIW